MHSKDPARKAAVSADQSQILLDAEERQQSRLLKHKSNQLASEPNQLPRPRMVNPEAVDPEFTARGREQTTEDRKQRCLSGS